MGKIMKRLVIAAMGAVLCLSLASCSSKDVAYPVALDGTEIIVGETTLSTLYDAGYTIEALNMKTHIGSSELEASFQLDANSYYTALYAQKGDVAVATLAIVTDKKAIPASEAVIGMVEVNAELDHAMDTATFDGVILTELTAEKFQEHVAGSKVRDDGTSAYIAGNKYTIRADYKDGVPISLEMKRNYDVDYSS